MCCVCFFCECFGRKERIVSDTTHFGHENTVCIHLVEKGIGEKDSFVRRSVGKRIGERDLLTLQLGVLRKVQILLHKIFSLRVLLSHCFDVPVKI